MSTLPLIIRFTTTSIPDLPLFPSPTTTPLFLLHTHIRPHLPVSLSTHPLRLISRGALLPLTLPLATSLRLPKSYDDGDGEKGKGWDAEAAGNNKGKAKQPPSEPLYIHCSIGPTPLSASALAAERAAVKAAHPLSLATDAPSLQHADYEHMAEVAATAAAGLSPSLATPTTTTTTTTTTPAPLGFDRLLSAGLTPAEITSLRSQFLALQAQTHTPDTMPSAPQLRLLEERWLDSGPSPSGGIWADTTTGEFEEDGEGGALEDMLWGNLLGFFWAVGGAVWMVREEGVWSRRRVVAVVTGVVVNVAFGCWRLGS